MAERNAPLPEAGLEVHHSLTSTMTPPGFAFIGKTKEMAPMSSKLTGPIPRNAKERQEKEMILGTPETKNLPTLTELVASSKKPRTNPRVVSGKKREAASQDNLQGARLSVPVTPELSLDHHASQTPIPGLFTQIHAGFLPEYTSSQFPGQGGNFGGGTTGSGGDAPGFLCYTSQCDVDGQVSELLERDVDFDGWLRDVGADEK
jgi:hypothetical protein